MSSESTFDFIYNQPDHRRALIFEAKINLNNFTKNFAHMQIQQKVVCNHLNWTGFPWMFWWLKNKLVLFLQNIHEKCHKCGKENLVKTHRHETKAKLI